MVRLFLDNGSGERPELDLMADSFPELSRTNPFLTNEGSQSIPFTLPASKGNLEKLDFPQRPALSVRKNTKPKAILSDGTAWIQGTLYIESVNIQEGITCTFYTNEGRLYEKLKGYRLRDISWDTIGNDGDSVDTLMSSFAAQINGTQAEDDKYLFCGAGTDLVFNLKNDYSEDKYLMLNEIAYTGTGSEVKFVGAEAQTYYDGTGDSANKITTLKGFGVTPFLRVGYVVRKIFEHLGYKTKFDRFDSDISFNRLVILNNVVDACVKGAFSAGDLLPDMDLEEFVSALRAKFGMEFIEVGDTIEWRSWNDILEINPDFDIKSVNYPTFLYEDKKGLEMELQFLTANPTLTSKDSPIAHYTPSGMEAETISFKDKTPSISNFASSYLFELAQIDDVRSNLSIPNVGGICLINSQLQYESGNAENEQENGIIELSICFALPGIIGNEYTNQEDPFGEKIKYPYKKGGITEYSINGNKWGNFNLYVGTLEGYDFRPGTDYSNNLYELFYKSRDEMLQKANQQIVVEARIPAHLINTMDVSTPKVLDDVKVLIERIDYVLGKEELCQVTARTLEPMS